MMKIQRDIQIDAIKKRELFKVTKYEGYALITDGIYGVYVNDEDLLLNPDKFNDVADKESFDRYEMEDSEGVKVLNEAITFVYIHIRDNERYSLGSRKSRLT